MRFFGRALAVAAILITALSAAEAKEWTKIRIGTEGAYPPFNFYDSNRQLQGFDIDIARAMCAAMKVECEFIAQDWDGIIPALLANKYDAIIASMTATDERRKVIDFSDKYYATPSSFIVRKDGGLKDTSVSGLKGKTVGAQASTIQAAHLEDAYKNSNVKLYPTIEEVYLDLAAGRLDALLVDKVVGLDWLENKPDGKCCTFAGENAPIVSGVGVGLRKEDQDLKAMFNKAIQQIRADGTYEKINAKYFKFSIY